MSINDKVQFYECFAHSLTVSVRVVWSSETLSLEEQHEQMKWLNEIQHRVVAKIQVERLQRHVWPENEFNAMLGHYIKLCPGIDSGVGGAIKQAYKIVNGAKT